VQSLPELVQHRLRDRGELVAADSVPVTANEQFANPSRASATATATKSASCPYRPQQQRAAERPEARCNLSLFRTIVRIS
jgi:hypothetical protein